MSVIIRLQNLPWSANALDIRQYFQGLSIPEGGVHIVGGEQGDAFIAFSTDEDARQAMLTDGGKIKEVKVKLQLSSRTEMQKVIEQARQQSVSLQTLLQMPAPPILAPVTLPTVTIPVAPTPPVLPAAVPAAPVVVETAVKQPERRDSKEKRDRRDRSRSRDRFRRDRDRRRRDRSRSRDRRRRRSRDRSRERSKDRDRSKDREKSKDRERSKDADRRRNSKDTHAPREPRRTSVNKDGRDLNGSDNKPSGGALANPVWEVPPTVVPPAAKPSPVFNKSPIIPNRPVHPPLPPDRPEVVPIGRGDMDGRRIMGSGPFPGPIARPLGPMGSEPSSNPFQPAGWMPVNRFPFQQPQPQSFNEGNDFDFRANSYRGNNFRGRGDGRGPFGSHMASGPGSILKPPGTVMGPNSFPRPTGPMDTSFPPRDHFEPFNRTFRQNYDPRTTLPGCCVEIRNMPLDVGYSELRKFFQGLYISNNAIKMINDNKGYRIGMAYMRFANAEAKDRAIKHTGKTIRGSVIEVLHVDDDIFDKAVDNFRPDKISDVEKPTEPVSTDSPCVFIQDLPPYAKEGDIYKLFPELTITDVVLMNKDKQYVAYVKFLRPEDSKKALYCVTKPTIGHKAVSLSLCAKELFIQAKQVIVAAKEISKINGSPTKTSSVQSDDKSPATEARSRPDPAILPESRTQGSNSDPRSRPMDSDPRRRATEVPDTRGQPREVSKQPRDQVPDHLGRSSEAGDVRPQPMEVSDHRSLPIMPADNRNRPIDLMDHRGRPMDSHDHRSRPMETLDHRGRNMDRMDYRNRPMDIPDHRGHSMDVMDHRNRPMDSMDHRHRMESHGMLDHREGMDHRGRPMDGPGRDCILLKGLPFHAKDRDILDFFSDVGLVPIRIHMMLDNFQKPTGDAYCEFQTSDETMRASGKNNTMLGKHEVTVQPVLRAEMNNVLGIPPPDMEMGGPRGPFPPPGRFPVNRTLLGTPRMPPMGGRGPMIHPMGPAPDPAPVEGFGNPGCVLALENIPFRAEVEEILEYFQDFEVTRENIIRRFNDLGMATGDARVSFPSPAEAQRAARELRGGKIRGRPIFVTLV